MPASTSTAPIRRPLAKLPSAAAQCAEQGAAYGKCMGLRYQDVEHRMCDKEWTAFAQCVKTAERNVEEKDQNER
ncbi:hypothetical protein JCM8547_006458 [Rhodosporidiobolus lusitaniae]